MTVTAMCTNIYGMDVSKVTSMQYTFAYLDSFNTSLSNIGNISNVTNANGTFYACKISNQPLMTQTVIINGNL